MAWAAATVVLLGLLGVIAVGKARSLAWWTQPLPGGFAGEAPRGWKPVWRADQRTTARFDAGVLTIAPAAGADGAVYNGVTSARRFDFTGQSRGVQVDLSRFHPQEGAEVKFRITKAHQTDFASLAWSGAGELSLGYKHGEPFSEQTIPFDPVAHAWFRIRHEPKDDTLRWETSPDGKAWTERRREPRGFDLSAVVLEIYAGTFKPVPDPGVIRFRHCCNP